MKIVIDLNLGFLFVLLSFLVTFLVCWQTCCSRAEKKYFIKFVFQSYERSKKFSTKKWAVSSVEDLCKIEKTNFTERKTGAERQQTARSEQNYRHATELICSQEGNTRSSGIPKEMLNLTAISLSSGAARSCHGHKTSSLMYLAIVSKCFWRPSIIS